MRSLLVVPLLAIAYRVDCDCGRPVARFSSLDAGFQDAGVHDSGSADAALQDGGPPDAGPPDAGAPDAEAPDAGFDAGPPPRNLLSVVAGGATSCALLRNGTVKCWGSNAHGELGNGSDAGFSALPVLVAGINTATQVSMGADHACALLAGGSVRCWGSNITGQLGNGTMTDSPVPVTVVGIADAIAVSAGGQSPIACCLNGHSCALLDGGSVRCWGDNNWGELGDGTLTNRPTPVTALGVTNVQALVATGADTCALLDGGKVHCWGTDNQRELSGSMGISGAAILAGSPSGDSLLVILADGTMRGWGHDLDGQLGDGTTGLDQGSPVVVMGIADAGAAAVSGETNSAPPGHGCAVLSDGTVRCWADNNRGQLGNGSIANSLAPVKVLGISDALQVAVGDPGYSCALLKSDTIACWGDGSMGQLGPSVMTYSAVPVTIPGLP